MLNSLDPFEHDEDDSDDKDNLPPAHVQDHPTDVKVFTMCINGLTCYNDLWLPLIESNINKWFLIVFLLYGYI